MLPDQRTRGQFPEAFSSSHRADTAPVLQQRGEFSQAQKVYRRLRDVPVDNPVAERAKPGQSPRVRLEGLEVSEAQARGARRRGGRSAGESLVESIPVDSPPVPRSLPCRQEVLGASDQLLLQLVARIRRGRRDAMGL